MTYSADLTILHFIQLSKLGVVQGQAKLPAIRVHQRDRMRERVHHERIKAMLI